jgi:peptidoglycan/LPS O-acetylase OafA/YrhL
MDHLDLSQAIAFAVGGGTAFLLLTRARGSTWRRASLVAIAYGVFIALVMLLVQVIPDVGPIDGKTIIFVVVLTALVLSFLTANRRRRARAAGSVGVGNRRP